jgi:two-component system phosphate regulon sensor histidine kinase PhoR
MNHELFIITILFIALIFLIVRQRRISAAIKEISDFLKALSYGNLDARLFPADKGELDGIARDIVLIIEKVRERLDFAETEKKEMEAILRGMSDGVLIADVRGMVILANQTFKKLMSIPDDIEGKQMLEVFRNVRLVEIFRKALESKDIISEEISVLRPHRDMHLIATAIPVYSGESTNSIVFTLHDITRLRQLEEMRKDFVANVSHEIKTPITAIKGFAETLLNGAIYDKDNAVRFLDMIKNHSERLNSLVDDLMTLSRIELGDMPIQKSAVNVEQIIDMVFMTLQEKASRKGLYLKKTMPDETQIIYADKDRLIQIMLNIVDNGIKFTEKGGVTVGIDYSGGRRVLYIQDTGIGIPQNDIHRLGERFYRVDGARSREMGGTGLGLAIVKHLVNAHGWNMAIESAIGRGTKVNIIVDRYM